VQQKVKVTNRNRISAKRFNAHHHHVASDETDKAISFINSQNFGWKADVCKLQKHHAEYGSHCDKPLNLAQVSGPAKADSKKSALVQAKAEAKTKTKLFGEKTDDFKKVLKKVQ